MFGVGDALAIAVGVAIAFVLLRGRVRRALGAAALGGLWFASSSAFMALLVVLALVGAAWATWRLAASAKRRLFWTVATTAGAALSLLVVLPSASRAPSLARHDMEGFAGDDVTVATIAPMASSAPASGEDRKTKNGQALAIQQQLAAAAVREPDALAMGGAAGVMGGVTPVALAMPSFAHTIVVESELVTPERPFRPRVVYVTTTAITALGGAWLAALLLLAWTLRREARELVRRVRERLAKPAPESASAPAE
jgi:hypothetical protein